MTRRSRPILVPENSGGELSSSLIRAFSETLRIDVLMLLELTVLLVELLTGIFFFGGMIVLVGHRWRTTAAAHDWRNVLRQICRTPCGRRQGLIEPTQHVGIMTKRWQYWVDFKNLRSKKEINQCQTQNQSTQTKHSPSCGLRMMYSWSWWLGGVCHVSGDRTIYRSLDLCANWGCRRIYEGTCRGFQVEFT